MKEGTYITIQWWMVNELKLKGNELLVFAIIYGFCQDGESVYNGSAACLAEWTNSSRRGVMKTLKSLLEKKYITKIEETVKGVKYCKYATKFIGYEQSSQGGVNKVHRGYEQSSHNNIEDNSYDNIYYVREKSKKFIKPTIEEIKSYCKERKNNVDAETFFDFYESKGWVVGKSSMKDWKAAVRTWERSRNNVTNKPKEEPKSPYQTYEDWMAEKTNGRNAEGDVIEGLEDW